VAVFLGGALLMTPGVLTDVLGLALLLPPTRAFIRGRFTRWLKRKLRMQQVIITGAPGPSASSPPGGRVFDQHFD
jgi:UPF0716 protein FxsA